jgi:hypothetical protein
MKYAAEIGSDVMTYIPSSIRTVSAIQKLIVGGYSKSAVIIKAYFYFFKIRKIG